MSLTVSVVDAPSTGQQAVGVKAVAASGTLSVSTLTVYGGTAIGKIKVTLSDALAAGGTLFADTSIGLMYTTLPAMVKDTASADLDLLFKGMAPTTGNVTIDLAAWNLSPPKP